MTKEAGKTTTDEAGSGRINPIHELVGALFGPKAVDQLKEAKAKADEDARRAAASAPAPVTAAADMSADALEAGADSEKASG